MRNTCFIDCQRHMWAGSRGGATGGDVKRIGNQRNVASCSLVSGIRELYNPHLQLEGIGLIVNLIFLECPFFSVSQPKRKESRTLINESKVGRGQLGGLNPPGSYTYYFTPWQYFECRLNELFPLAS